jgi:hypothetical protein
VASNKAFEALLGVPKEDLLFLANYLKDLAEARDSYSASATGSAGVAGILACDDTNQEGTAMP